MIGLLERLRLRRGIRRKTIPNRETRRSMARLARIPRAEIEKIAAEIRRLPKRDREILLARLPDYHAEQIRKFL